uniref:Methylenetetrahydrofolate--tRNA-(uracil-5-)-methyltransferase TrmFO n=1 Tax=candidate division WOR-3 bacterium TaxID=2052148 RepID=A0A7C4UAM7_UNCW3
MHSDVQIIGCGLSGSECAMFLISKGIDVTIKEMRPFKMTEAHKTGYFAELVCSNSLKSDETNNAQGILKMEMKNIGSKVLEFAYKNRIKGGKALVVDRERFAKDITDYIESNAKVIREEAINIDESKINVIATGPLTSKNFLVFLKRLTGEKNLYFYDAVSPIILSSSIDYDYAFWGSRNKEGDDYLNLPLTKEEYEKFVKEIKNAEMHLPHIKEDLFFKGCMPVEEIAKTGKDSLRFSVMKPVGLKFPERFKDAYACVQLRREDNEGKAFSIVGFQTRLKISEQERVFRIIPALRNAVFLRYGMIHRNTYINTPILLDKFLRLKDNIFIIGTLIGLEGYMEATLSGLYAGINIERIIRGKKPVPPPEGTIFEGIFSYLFEKRASFKPINANFGILKNYNKKEKDKILENSIKKIKEWEEFYEI